MTWNVSSLHKSPVSKPTTTTTSPASTAQQTTNQTTQTKQPKTAEDFSKLSFSGKAQNTGLATANARATSTNVSATTNNQRTNPASNTDQLSTDKKREIMTNMQKDFENRLGNASGSSSKQAATNNAAKLLKEVDLKEVSDQDIEKLFNQVQEKLKAAQPNNAYQNGAVQASQMQTNMNFFA